MELSLSSFRNIVSGKLHLGERTAIIGGNGRGKTNILESLYVLFLGSSFRKVTSQDLITEGSHEAIIALKADHQYALRIQYSGREVRTDGKRERLEDRVGRLPLVLFAPEEFLFFVGSDYRRHLLNRLLSQTDQSYKAALFRYRGIIRQRNHLLRHSELPERLELIRTFDVELTPLAVAIQAARRTAIEELNQALISRHQFSLAYFPSERQSDTLSRELFAHTTIKGPHRDDLLLLYREHNAVTHASRGEQRVGLLELSVAEAQYLERHTDQPPLLLFDDVLAELDSRNRTVIRALLGHYHYVLTATDLAFLPPAIRRESVVIDLDKLAVTNSDMMAPDVETDQRNTTIVFAERRKST